MSELKKNNVHQFFNYVDVVYLKVDEKYHLFSVTRNIQFDMYSISCQGECLIKALILEES